MGRPKRIVSLFVAAAIPYTVAQCAGTRKDSEPFTIEDYAILSAALNELYGRDFQTVVLLDRTSTGFPPGMAAWTRFGGRAEALLTDATKEARDDLEGRNKAYGQVEGHKLRIRPRLLVLGADDATNLINCGGWAALNTKYPSSSGLAVVSLPGINARRNAALLYVANSCNLLCGEGVLVFLRKEGKEWKVLQKTTLWFS